MKKFILTLSILILSSQTVFAAPNDKQLKDLSRAAEANRQHYFEVCENISRNFRADFKFTNYMRSKCAYTANDTYAMADAIFFSIPDEERRSKKDYRAEKSQLIITNLNKNLDNYKEIITEYCKYNSAKFSKKSPQACTQSRIESLFSY